MNKDLLTLQKELKKNRHDISLAFNELAEIKEKLRVVDERANLNTKGLDYLGGVSTALKDFDEKNKQNKKR